MDNQIAEPTPQLPAATCALCGSEVPWRVGTKRDCEGNWVRVASPHCEKCRRAVEFAAVFNRHFELPPRYAEAELHDELDARNSYLLLGPPGSGKTHAAYGILRFRALDPRCTIAAYSWPVVLLELRRSYSDANRDKGRAEAIIDALRAADAALIDDLGLENWGSGNLGWLHENLFLVLNDRWRYRRQTIVVSTLSVEELHTYFGVSVASRIAGMCQPFEMRAREWRRAMPDWKEGDGNS